MRKWQPEELNVIDAQYTHAFECGTDVTPVTLGELDTLGLTCRARGVDEGRELIARDGGCTLSNNIGLSKKLLFAELAQIIKRDDPIAIRSFGRAVEEDDLAKVSEF